MYAFRTVTRGKQFVFFYNRALVWIVKIDHADFEQRPATTLRTFSCLACRSCRSVVFRSKKKLGWKPGSRSSRSRWFPISTFYDRRTTDLQQSMSHHPTSVPACEPSSIRTLARHVIAIPCLQAIILLYLPLEKSVTPSIAYA